MCQPSEKSLLQAWILDFMRLSSVASLTPSQEWMKKNNNSETYSTLRNRSKFPKIVHLGFCNITFLSFNKKADVNPVKVCLLTLSLSGFS